MVTAAAALAQIACQQQRVRALEESLATMESGMEKHMVQVCVTPAAADGCADEFCLALI